MLTQCEVYMAKILAACLKQFYHNQLPYIQSAAPRASEPRDDDVPDRGDTPAHAGKTPQTSICAV